MPWRFCGNSVVCTQGIHGQPFSTPLYIYRLYNRWSYCSWHACFIISGCKWLLNKHPITLFTTTCASTTSPLLLLPSLHCCSWQTLVHKNYEIEKACLLLETEVRQLKHLVKDRYIRRIRTVIHWYRSFACTCVQVYFAIQQKTCTLWPYNLLVCVPALPSRCYYCAITSPYLHIAIIVQW